MVTLSDIFDRDLLTSHIAAGLVTSRPHSYLPLAVLNYTPECQWLRAWDDVTTACRGLIYNTETDEVVSRPFGKFFNWDESGQRYPPSGPVIRMPKMDGSLGILWATDYSNGTPTNEGISTRGSMNSEQARWATNWYRNFVVEQFNTLPSKMVFSPLEGKTYLFEIIYPQNRIVVDYGDYEGLFLLDVIDNATGLPDLQEFDDCAWPEKVNRISMPGFDVMHAADIPEGDEGFVYLWPGINFRTKMKSADYVILHRLISNLNEKSVWEQLVAGKTVDEIKKDLPEEFHDFIESVYNEIMMEVGRVLIDTANELARISGYFQDYDSPFDVPRAEIAREIVKSPYKSYLFMLLDRKPIYPVVLRASKPKRQTNLVAGDEA